MPFNSGTGTRDLKIALHGRNSRVIVFNTIKLVCTDSDKFGRVVVHDSYRLLPPDIQVAGEWRSSYAQAGKPAHYVFEFTIGATMI